MKLLKSIRMIVALVLVLTMIALVPLNTAAAANNGKYVSEVYVAYGKDAEDAKKTLEDKGFTPVDGNLNEGGKTYAMIGCKTTNDIRDSITDLAVMNMNGGYSVEDYKTFLKSKKTQIAEFLNEFTAVIKEYRANLKAGKANATLVHDLLNNYTEDDTGMKMGDLLNSETLQDRIGINESIEAANPENLPDLITILMQGNAQVIKSVEVLLSMAADSADNTWIDRFSQLDYDTLLDQVSKERPDLNTETKQKQYLDNIYGDAAFELGMAANTLRDKLNDYASMKLHIKEADEQKLENNFGNTKEDYRAVLQTQEWLSIGSIYESLKSFEGGNYAKGELLDFFLEENDPEDEEIYYPMAAALSEGQRYGMPFIGFEQLIQHAFATEESWQQIAQSNQTQISSLKDVSVYAEIDREIYSNDGSVAVTDKAQRENTAGSVGTNGNQESQNDTFTAIVKISCAATVFTAISAAVAAGVSYSLVRSYAYGGKELGWLQENLNEIFKLDKASLDEMAGIPMFEQNVSQIYNARFAIQAAKILVIATIFLAVASAVLTIIDMLRDKSVEQLPIPKYLVDNYTNDDGGSFQLNYKAVECNREEYFGEDYTKQKGSSADLLADEGTQWLALYASKNSKAGNSRPITPQFAIQQTSDAPTGFDTNIHLFGEKGAVNIVGNAFKLYSAASHLWQSITGDYSVYVFCKCSSDVKTYDEASGNMTASLINDGMLAIFGFGGLAVGAVLGAVIAVMINKNKKKKETA